MSARLDPGRGDAAAVSLDDKWNIDDGRVLLSGTQALVRVLLAQSTLDRRAGLHTAGFISGYRGSPLGGVDTTLWSVAPRLAEAGIVFQPGLNEDLAATAVHGSQQLDAVPHPKFDGVFAAWYGKGPGVDRSCDAFKHGNFAGTHRNGGVLVFYGDDHAGKSSTVAHHSEQAIAASLIPSLYPANVQEVVEFGLLGYAMSRYSGSWVGIKCVAEVAEQTATVDLHLSGFVPVEPESAISQPDGLYAQQGAFNPLRDEEIVVEHRLPRVQAFVRANAIDRTVLRAERPALGLVTAGKSYGDVRSALSLLGLDDARAVALGISLYKVGCIWPLEPDGLTAFAAGHRTLFVIEEKANFIEMQAAAVLINQSDRPTLIGKRDESGRALLSAAKPLDAHQIARAIGGRLEALGLLDEGARKFCAASSADNTLEAPATPKRTPYFCSGCPHNRSTQIPNGSVSMTGIGCHTIANFVQPSVALLPVQMGGEGANWLGLAPFTSTAHVFQNMGDGTYYHSGLLAIRAAVAAKVNVTYKILYNDAVAMTGGQPVDGPLSVASMAAQLLDEGVVSVTVLSDDPTRHRHDPQLPSAVSVGHRDTLDTVQRRLRDTPGCTILIYQQTCATTKRRARKRGALSSPSKRLFISTEVCEGCGDCSVQSTCVSLVPVDTELGRKRAVDQSNCNKDFSCLNGFCPSFITVYGADPRKPAGALLDDRPYDDLPAAALASLRDGRFNLLIAGVGGTGVITVGALLGMAAHLDGLSVSLFDMTGLAQKNGAVFTHVRLGSHSEVLHAQRLARGEADVLLAFDLIAALSPEATSTLHADRTQVIANADVSPTAAFQFDRNLKNDPADLLARLERAVGTHAVTAVDASSIALAALGDTIGANLFMLGVAAQRGLLPVSMAALEAAVALNAVAVSFNLRALRLGRLFVSDPARVIAELKRVAPPAAVLRTSLADVVDERLRHLNEYQGAALAERYRARVLQVSEAETRVVPGSQQLALVVAHQFARLLAYKDEYEVARLLTSRTLRAELQRNFMDGGRIAFNLAPPLFARLTPGGRPRKREFGSWITPLMMLLKRGRVLRGTLFDPFGWTVERQLERALINDYDQLISKVLATLQAGNHASAVALLALAGDVRGFGPVKLQSAEVYRTRVAAALATYCSATASRA